MDELHTQNEGQLESGQARSSELQALDSATYEPSAYVERGGDYQQAEAVQATLVAVIDTASSAQEIGAPPQPIPHEADEEQNQATQITLPDRQVQPEEVEEGHPPEPPDLNHNPYPEDAIAAPGSDSLAGGMPAIRGDLDQATVGEGSDRQDATPIPLPGQQGVESQAPVDTSPLEKSIDPETGQAISEQGKPSGTGVPSPRYAGQQEDLIGEATLNEKPAIQAPDTGIPQDAHAAPPHPDEVAWSEEGTGTMNPMEGKPIGKGDGGPGGHKDADPSNIEHELPEALIDAIGQGTQGLIQGNAAHGGPGGSHTSGGGAPVTGHGQGLTGKTTIQGWSYEPGTGDTKWKGSSNDSASKTANRALEQAQRSFMAGGTGVVEVHGKDGSYSIIWGAGDLTFWKWYPIDGASPIPYTGSGTGHQVEIPHGPGSGPDHEANFLRKLAGGKTNPKIYVGMGSSGSTMFSPSGGGQEDDAGKFHGGLDGSAYRPNNPDDPDYYTPNVLDQADKAKKAS
jgi:hypothetical protein